MKLIVTEKNIAAKKLAEILAVGKPTTDKVYNTPVYKFRRDGEDWIAIGLKGHILGVDFPLQLAYEGRQVGGGLGRGTLDPGQPFRQASPLHRGP